MSQFLNPLLNLINQLSLSKSVNSFFFCFGLNYGTKELEQFYLVVLFVFCFVFFHKLKWEVNIQIIYNLFLKNGLSYF